MHDFAISVTFTDQLLHFVLEAVRVSENCDSWPESRASYEAAADGSLAGDPIKPPVLTEREGLPPSYRMRADRHYVDQLAGASAGQPVRMIATGQIDAPGPAPDGEIRPLIESIRALGIVHPLLVRRQHSRYALIAGRKRLIAARTLRLAAVPCLVHEVAEADAAALAAADDLRVGVPQRDPDLPSGPAAARRLIAAHLRTVGRCAEMAVDGVAGLHRTGLDLMRAHAWRADRLIAALELIAHATFPSQRQRAFATTIDEVIDGFGPELRLSGVTIRAEIGDVAMTGLHEAELAIGLAGAFIATLPLVEHGDRPALLVRAANTASGSVVVQVIQSDASVSERLIADFFADDPSTDRPGGYAAAIGALAAKALAERHGGDATIELVDHGSRLTLVLMRRS